MTAVRNDWESFSRTSESNPNSAASCKLFAKSDRNPNPEAKLTSEAANAVEIDGLNRIL